jgi:alkanesulfonate monooxygenase SsuD/methylene tetrahydromethanopterin reductase-like flavin-dependent oxidoreductase (luciferase family)
MKMLEKVGILDIGLVGEKGNLLQTLERTITSVQLADELGYSRYWLGEHYEYPIAWHNPDILIGVLASITERIRIGSAGILLPLHPILRIAENYRLLSALFSDRIDLGIAFGTTDKKTIAKVIHEKDYEYNMNNHFSRVTKLDKYIKSGFYSDSKGFIPPNITPNLETWVLGTGGAGGINIATSIQSNYCLSLFHDGFDNTKIQRVMDFKDMFLQKNGFEPTINICCSLLYSEKQAKLDKLKDTCIGKQMKINIIGNINKIKEQLLVYAEVFGTKELIVVDLCNDSEQKIDFIKILAEEFNLIAK